MFLRVGTRKSKLALIQTNLVIEELRKHNPSIGYEIVPITTTGDKIINKNLYDIGGKALFLKELEEALLNRNIDLAVHSLKDVPGNLNPNFEIISVLERSCANEVFVSKYHDSIANLPLNAVVGSSSVRRCAFLLNQRPDLTIIPFRGNVDFRINKVLNNEVDGTLLALAGLHRLNLFNQNYCYTLGIKEILPAPGQGIIAIEILKHNNKIKEICSKINHIPTFQMIQVERSYVDHLNASCSTPVAAYTDYLDSRTLLAKFMLAKDYHSKMHFYEVRGDIKDGPKMGIEAAKFLLSKL